MTAPVLTFLWDGDMKSVRTSEYGVSFNARICIQNMLELLDENPNGVHSDKVR